MIKGKKKNFVIKRERHGIEKRGGGE